MNSAQTHFVDYSKAVRSRSGSRGVVAPRKAIDYAVQIATALAAAHERGDRLRKHLHRAQRSSSTCAASNSRRRAKRGYFSRLVRA